MIDSCILFLPINLETYKIVQIPLLFMWYMCMIVLHVSVRWSAYVKVREQLWVLILCLSLCLRKVSVALWSVKPFSWWLEFWRISHFCSNLVIRTLDDKCVLESCRCTLGPHTYSTYLLSLYISICGKLNYILEAANRQVGKYKEWENQFVSQIVSEIIIPTSHIYLSHGLNFFFQTNSQKNN